MKSFLKVICLFTLFLGFSLGAATEAQAQSKPSLSKDGKSMDSPGVEKVLISSQPSATIQLKRARGNNSYIVYTGKATKMDKKQNVPIAECGDCIKWTKVGGALLVDDRNPNQKSLVRTECYPDSDYLKIVVLAACDECVAVEFKDCK